MKSALAVLAMLMGTNQGIHIQETHKSSGFESEGVEVLVDTGSHIELGMNADVKATSMSQS